MYTTLIISIFIVGYLCIVFEHNLKVNKAPIALFMCVACWTCYFLGVEYFVSPSVDAHDAAHSSLLHHLSEACEILFFLMAAMTIVEIIDSNGGFNFVRSKLLTRNKRVLLWRVALITFFLSALLDTRKYKSGIFYRYKLSRTVIGAYYYVKGIFSAGKAYCSKVRIVKMGKAL